MPKCKVTDLPGEAYKEIVCKACGGSYLVYGHKDLCNTCENAENDIKHLNLPALKHFAKHIEVLIKEKGE